MPRAASPVCVTYAAPGDVGGWTIGGSVPWTFEEPPDKRLRLSVDLSCILPAWSAAAARGDAGILDERCDKRLRRWGDDGPPASAGPEAACRRSHFALDEPSDQADYRSEVSLGQLPSKRPRTTEEAWWAQRPGEELRFVWGPLPLRATEPHRMLVQAPPPVLAAEDAAMDGGAGDMLSDKATAATANDAGSRETRVVRETREVMAFRSTGCTALVPYLGPYFGPTAAACWLRAGGSTTLLPPAARLAGGGGALALKVPVAQVVVDDQEELRAVVVHRSQALHAARRLGQTMRHVQHYQLLDDGHVLIPISANFQEASRMSEDE